MRHKRHLKFTSNQLLIIWVILAIVLVALTQAPSYQIETINWDESTFALCGADLLRGNLPYINTLDNKPPVLYITIALALKLFGLSVISVRLLGDILIFGTAFFIFLILKKYVSHSASYWGSLLFIAMTVVPYAQYTSSEIIAIFYLLAAITVLVNYELTPWTSILSGVFMSLAVLVRTNLALTAIAGISIYFMKYYINQDRKLWINSLLYVLGGIIPPGFLFLIYILNNKLSYLVLGLIKVPLSYSESAYSFWGLFARHGYLWLKYIKLSPYVAVPVTLLFIMTGHRIMTYISHNKQLISSRVKNRSLSDSSIYYTYFLLLFLATAFSMFISGGVYAHYQIQVFPFIAVICIAGIQNTSIKIINRLKYIIILSITIAVFNLLPETFKTISTFPTLEQNFPGRQLADTIDNDLSASDQIWALENHITLLYLEKDPIIPLMAHPSNLTKSSYVTVLKENGYVKKDPFDTILDLKPKYIITGQYIVEGSFSSAQNNRLKAFINDFYKLINSVDGINLYKLKP